MANDTIFIICARYLAYGYKSYEDLINRNWEIIEECGYKKQVILISSTIYFYLIDYFLLLPTYTNYGFDPKKSALSRDTGPDIDLISNFQICLISYSLSPP